MNIGANEMYMGQDMNMMGGFGGFY